MCSTGYDGKCGCMETCWFSSVFCSSYYGAIQSCGSSWWCSKYDYRWWTCCWGYYLQTPWLCRFTFHRFYCRFQKPLERNRFEHRFVSHVSTYCWWNRRKRFCNGSSISKSCRGGNCIVKRCIRIPRTKMFCCIQSLCTI